jgi:hypothetical protein
MNKSTQNFLTQLQKQAQLQSKLEEEKVLPKQVEFFSAFIGNYPWQFLLVISLFSAVVLELAAFLKGMA